MHAVVQMFREMFKKIKYVKGGRAHQAMQQRMVYTWCISHVNAEQCVLILTISVQVTKPLSIASACIAKVSVNIPRLNDDVIQMECAHVSIYKCGCSALACRLWDFLDAVLQSLSMKGLQHPIRVPEWTKYRRDSNFIIHTCSPFQARQPIWDP